VGYTEPTNTIDSGGGITGDHQHIQKVDERSIHMSGIQELEGGRQDFNAQKMAKGYSCSLVITCKMIRE